MGREKDTSLITQLHLINSDWNAEMTAQSLEYAEEKMLIPTEKSCLKM